MQVTLLLAILLFNFSAGKTSIAYAAPSNDNFAGRTIIGAIPYLPTPEDTTTATEEQNDPQVNVACDGKLLAKGWKSVWYQYTPGANEFVSFDTVGTDYDTYIAVWNSPSLNNSSFVGCDDDINAGYQSKLLISATAGITYYIEIAQYNGTQGGVPTTPTGGTLQFHANYPNINIQVGGTLKGRYYVQPGSSERDSYAGLNSGPVQLASSNGLAMLGAERVIYNVNGVPTSFSEMMGLPNSQLNNTYWFPWYNNVDLDTQLRFGNVGGTAAQISVTINGVPMLGTPFTLNGGQSTRLSFAGVNNGPVQVVSTVPIVVAERVIYNVNGVPTSFSEMMGLPNNQLNTTYWFPWYNNVNLYTQLRFGNVSGTPAQISVTINGTPMGSPFTLGAGQSTRLSFASIDNGPVQVVSTAPIVVAERVIYAVNGVPTSFSEIMGLPNNQLNTTYWMPWYNNVDLSTQLRFGNVSASTATVHIFIGGSEVLGSPYNLAPGQSLRQPFAGVNNGPVQIVSNVNIVAAERVIYTVNGVPTSFSEMMGLPNSQLSTIYWMPWYNNVDLDTQLRFGRP